MESTARRAIQAALNADWETAIASNMMLLAEAPEDIDALTRLAYAHQAAGTIDKAKKYAKAALKLDPDHVIASRILAKCELLKDKGAVAVTGKVSVTNFLETPGRTKITALKLLGSPKARAGLVVGEELKLECVKRQATVHTNSGKYVGKIPDDVALWVLMKTKMKTVVHVYVKSIIDNKISVLLKA
ncbi:hypothetical protein KBD68_03660 [Candidatus Woesebacteria bacterium]|nr:hypothetical protein [Candidatus Woesebacteria bacterium]